MAPPGESAPPSSVSLEAKRILSPKSTVDKKEPLVVGIHGVWYDLRLVLVRLRKGSVYCPRDVLMQHSVTLPPCTRVEMLFDDTTT